MKNLYNTNFDAPDAHFNCSSLFSGTQAEVPNSKKNAKIVKAGKTKYCAMRLSQMRRRTELCMRNIILCFEMNLENFLFS
jgi:hypothetical protein